MNLFQEIKNIVDEHDPTGFLAIGAPDDEYDIETDDLYVCFMAGNIETFHHMEVYVWDIFSHWLGELAGKRENYIELSKDLYDLYIQYWIEKNKWQ